MITVGVRELKQKISQLIRLANESGREVRITHHGKVVAFLIPVSTTQKVEEEPSWCNLDTLAAEIGAHWPKGLSAAEAISEARR